LRARPPDPLLRRYRLAAQKLTAESPASSATDAARAVCGVQAQDVRASHLALRSRVSGLERADVDGADLVRTWTVRGTVHLIAAADRDWLHSLCGPRFGQRFEAWIERRGGLETARGMRDDVVDLLAERPRDRASLLVELAERGHPDLGPHAVNVFVPWLAAEGLVVGLPDGRYRAADRPAAIDPDEALATMARRYLAGYGPASAADLAAWSGLPVGAARRGLEAIAPLEGAGDLVALPGTLDREPPPPAPALLLAAFDTAMLGWRSRDVLVPRDHGKSLLPGSGMVRPTVLVGGAVTGTWRLAGSGRRRAIEVDWFRRPAAKRALEAEARYVRRFLGLDGIEVHRRS
jgi:winged helix DNA-binding protein